MGAAIAEGIVVVLMLYAQQATHTVDIPFPAPEIQYTPYHELVSKACNKTKCDVRAWFSYDDGVIYLRNDQNIVDNMYQRSILLHEIIHHLQYHINSLQMANDCLTWKAREIEAHKIQYQWLYENRVHVPTLSFNIALVNLDSVYC